MYAFFGKDEGGSMDLWPAMPVDDDEFSGS